MNSSLVALREYISQYSREIIITVGVCGAGIAGIYFYADYRKQRIQAAQFDFSQCYQQYKQAQNGQGADWSEVEFLTAAGYKQHAATEMGPYFKALEVQAFIEQGKTAEALVALKTLLDALDHASPFKNIYGIKRALVLVSSADELQQKEGIEALEALAADKNNLQRDEALYYLGQQYAQRGQAEKSRQAWDELVTEFGKTDVFTSPWAALAQGKMA